MRRAKVLGVGARRFRPTSGGSAGNSCWAFPVLWTGAAHDRDGGCVAGRGADGSLDLQAGGSTTWWTVDRLWLRSSFVGETKRHRKSGVSRVSSGRDCWWARLADWSVKVLLPSAFRCPCRLQPPKLHGGVICEPHRMRDRPMPGVVRDQPVDLLADATVGRVALGGRCAVR